MNAVALFVSIVAAAVAAFGGAEDEPLIVLGGLAFGIAAHMGLLVTTIGIGVQLGIARHKHLRSQR